MEFQIIGFSIVSIVFFVFGIGYLFFRDWAWDNHVSRMRRRGMTDLKRTREWEQITQLQGAMMLFFGCACVFVVFRLLSNL